MIREFDDSGSWIWAVYGVIYAAMLAVGIFMGNRQSIFALYLPLDILICAGLAYFYFRLKGKEEEKKKEDDDEVMNRRLVNAQLVCDLLSFSWREFFSFLSNTLRFFVGISFHERFK